MKKRTIGTGSWVLVCVVLCGFGLGSCGFTAQRMVETKPEGARVYINGEYQGPGGEEYTFSFKTSPRLFLQVSHPGFRAYLNKFTREKLERNQKIVVTLKE